MAVEIGRLAGLDLFALRERWRTHYGSEPLQRMSRELLMRAVAYRMQENAFGGLSRAIKARLAAAAEEGRRSGGKIARVRTDRTIKPGTKFLREWNGRTHEVMALVNGGFAYRGTVFRSLSAIAREITGTRWSGPAFFGLGAGKGTGGVARSGAPSTPARAAKRDWSRASTPSMPSGMPAKPTSPARSTRGGSPSLTTMTMAASRVGPWSDRPFEGSLKRFRTARSTLSWFIRSIASPGPPPTSPG